jgi:hypothetical protein
LLGIFYFLTGKEGHIGRARYLANNKPAATINKINAIMEARVNLGHNAAPLLTVEALMCVLAR